MSIDETFPEVTRPSRIAQGERKTPLLVAGWIQILASFVAGPLAVMSAVSFGPNLPLFLSLLLWVLLVSSGLAILRGRSPAAWWLATSTQVPLLVYALGMEVFVYHVKLNHVELHAILVVFAGTSLTALMYLLRPRTRLQYGLSAVGRAHLPLPRTSRKRVTVLLITVLVLLGGYQSLLYCLLWDAFRTHDGVSVTRFIRYGAPLGWRSMLAKDTPLNAAAAQNDIEVTRALLAAGAMVNEPGLEGYSPAETAVLMGNNENLRLLLARGANPNSALECAIDAGAVDAFRLLLQYGADVNRTFPGGEYSLGRTAVRGYPEMAEALLDPARGYSVSGGSGAKVLLRAAVRGDVDTLRQCLNRGSSPDVGDAGGFTALMGASAFNRPEAARVLLKAGAPINAQDQHGRTALYWAIPNGPGPLVRLLLEHGPDLSLKDDKDRTVLLHAQNSGMEAVVAVLKRAGAPWL